MQNVANVFSFYAMIAIEHVFSCINIRQALWEMLKTAASGLGFQHLPQDLVNVNAWKTMFDPYNILTLKTPRKTASENVVCLCRLLNILADFSNLFLHTGKQYGPRSDCS